MDLTQEQIEFIETNRLIFTSNVTISKEQVVEMFSILSHITGKTQRPTGCGRCIASARLQVWTAYIKQVPQTDEE